MLDALVKRVNGLEKRLKDEPKPEPADETDGGDSVPEAETQEAADSGSAIHHSPPVLSPVVDMASERVAAPIMMVSQPQRAQLPPYLYELSTTPCTAHSSNHSQVPGDHRFHRRALGHLLRKDSQQAILHPR